MDQLQGNQKTEQMDSFVFYQSYQEAAMLAGLTKKQRCEFYEGIMDYAMQGVEPEFTSRVMKGIFSVCRRNIDANNQRKMLSLKNSLNGKKGGAPKSNRNACKSKTNNKKTSEKTSGKTSLTVTDTVTATETVTDTATVTATETATVTSSSLKEQEEKDLVQRNRDFFERLKPYAQQYGEKTLQRFYEYWKEKTADGTKMRFELEPSWDLKFRLEKWVEKEGRIDFNKA